MLNVLAMGGLFLDRKNEGELFRDKEPTFRDALSWIFFGLSLLPHPILLRMLQSYQFVMISKDIVSLFKFQVFSSMFSGTKKLPPFTMYIMFHVHLFL